MIRVFDEWLLLPQRVALHEPSATAVIADVHLGYSAVRQRLGDAIPLRSVGEEMKPLVDAAQRHHIAALVVAGDLFERGYDADLHQQLLDVLTDLRISFLGLVPGNHDRGIQKATNPMPLFPEGFDLAGWHIIHGDQPTGRERVVMGHFHPALRRQRRKVACFLVRNDVLVLPAFSQDAAGVDVQNDSTWLGWNAYGIDVDKVLRAIPTKEPRVASRGS